MPPVNLLDSGKHLDFHLPLPNRRRWPSLAESGCPRLPRRPTIIKYDPSFLFAPPLGEAIASWHLRAGYNAGAMTEVAQILSPFLGEARLSTDQLELVTNYLELLIRWNLKINLTATRDRQSILTRHFGESLFAARHLLPDPTLARSVTDIGSGGGFPGLLLKIWAPNLYLKLVDSSHKKAAFLKEVSRALNLSRITVLPIRAEDFSCKAEVVTMRAVERFEKMLPLLPKLLNPSGQLGLLIGQSQVDAATTLKAIRWSEPISIPLSRSRVLLIGES